MKAIQSTNYMVYFNNEAYVALNTLLKETAYSKLFILVDSNTHELCLPDFLANLVTDIVIDVIEIENGEIFKNIETCTGVWNAISELGGDRKGLILNLGGGVVTDLGGFVAATYMRGIDFVNVPTTLLSMVDASVGGKTGVDLGALKNQVGVFATPQMVLIITDFLKTLPAEELRSGMAEMMKHGLIADISYWDNFKNLKSLSYSDLDSLIYTSVLIKNEVVLADLKEQNLRKTLNFGHTLGHAIESFYLTSASHRTLLHGEAIAIGMILAAYLSYEVLNLSLETVEEIKHTIVNYFEKISLEESDYNTIINLMKHDKKNAYGNVNFVLLEAIGKPKIDIVVSNELIIKAFEYYKK